MPLDLTGISNENEFYTHHYLTALLENDLKDLLKEWSLREEEEKVRPPYAELRAISREYFTMRTSLEREHKADAKLQTQREFITPLLAILGYTCEPKLKDLDDGTTIPVLYEIARPNGAPELWVLEAFDQKGEEASPLDLELHPCQYPDEYTNGHKLPEGNFEDIIARGVFGRAEPPRWVLLVNHAQLVLLDRSKWHQKSLLRFDFQEIFGRRENSTLQAMAALLHRDSICPTDGLCLLDTLDENSHKHAFAVSEDLKYALRRSIELLGNEAVLYLREVRRKGIYSGEEKIDPAQLTIECLRYMYRLLFMFYIEARQDLGYAPMNADAYRSGYSLESLRDLELVKLTTEESRNGFYICESLSLLFKLIYDGFSPPMQKVLRFEEVKHHDIFEMPPLKSHLFDPERTPLLNRVRFKNSVMQEIIKLMSLSRENRRERRGRISYAQLGINQLGAVYEALLSYKGFFAEADLYEVKKTDEQWDELKTAYFVKEEDIEKYAENERVFNEDGTFKKYTKGTFIYRLAGRDREKSASYYTPEVLTTCLVKYALKELLKDKTADEILSLTVCEPAMGSAAFINEAINQLAEAYLQLKQQELKKTIPHDEYVQERQKVKMYIADNNVFGVDLNPVAVELAEVSLWLNTIHKGAYVPWFGMQLVCGNSLIGARRQIFAADLLSQKKKSDALWLDEVPVRVMPGNTRPKHTVYHFLLPDKGMADYSDPVIKKMAEVDIKKIKDWRKDFTKQFAASDTKQLEKLSLAVDKLWDNHTKQQKAIRSRTTDPLQVFGQPEPDKECKFTSTGFKDKVFDQERLSKEVRNSSSYRRLKLVMDYWCALWFWPIEQTDLLPSREEFLLEISLILEGNVFDASQSKDNQLRMFPDTTPKQLALQMVDQFGFVDVDKLCRESKRLSLVKELAEKYYFLHWELEFADLFDERGGFDLLVGNPPWIKLGWNEAGLLGDNEPLFVLRCYSAAQVSDLRKETIVKKALTAEYFSKYVEMTGMQNYLGAQQNYPLLLGTPTNLYKCFVCQSWAFESGRAVSSFITDEGIYNNPSAGALRQNCYQRLRYWFNFKNEKSLFKDVGHAKNFELSIYSQPRQIPNFFLIANLFHPITIDECFQSEGVGVCGGIKDNLNNWNIHGHKDRIVPISHDALALFANLYDEPGTNAHEARLPLIHSGSALRVLTKFAIAPRKLNDIRGDYYATTFWGETDAERDGTIKLQTQFITKTADWVLVSPHIYVANLFHQTPECLCNTRGSFERIDLTEIPDDYLPRTKYSIVCDEVTLDKRLPRIPWAGNRPATDFYRLVSRKRLTQPGERTLTSAILPPDVKHIITCISFTFRDNKKLLDVGVMLSSLPYDFFVKSSGKADFLDDLARQLPLLELNADAYIRFLSLCCATTHFANFWAKVWNIRFQSCKWSKLDDRLPADFFSSLTAEWQRHCALRIDYARRQALVEIDVLVAQALGLTLVELCTIYRIQFPVLRQNENDTWYDQNGRIVFTCSKGLPGVGFSRPEWNEIKDMKSGTIERKTEDDTMPGGPRERIITYIAPFDKCDRDQDYATAWAEFEKRLKQ